MSAAITEEFSPALVEGIKHYYSVTQRRNLMSAGELSMHIERSILNNRESQKKIYWAFYGYTMAVCDLYTNSQDHAIAILNDGFLKIFKEIHRYKPAYTDVISSFKSWLRKIMVYTAIEHFLKNHKYQLTTGPDDVCIQGSIGSEDAPGIISNEEIIRSIQELTPVHRTVFNLFIIEGFTYEEISEQLGISTCISKSHLAKAKETITKNIISSKSNAGNQR